MADYKELLRRAVEALPENNGAARRAVYEKARAALVGQLRAINPPLAARDITAHRLQLEDCIRQVEQEASEAVIAGLGAAEPDPPPGPAPVYFDPPVVQEKTRPPLLEPRPRTQPTVGEKTHPPQDFRPQPAAAERTSPPLAMKAPVAKMPVTPVKEPPRPLPQGGSIEEIIAAANAEHPEPSGEAKARTVVRPDAKPMGKPVPKLVPASRPQLAIEQRPEPQQEIDEAPAEAIEMPPPPRPVGKPAGGRPLPSIVARAEAAKLRTSTTAFGSPVERSLEGPRRGPVLEPRREAAGSRMDAAQRGGQALARQQSEPVALFEDAPIAAALSADVEVEFEQAVDPQGAIDRAIATLDREARAEVEPEAELAPEPVEEAVVAELPPPPARREIITPGKIKIDPRNLAAPRGDARPQREAKALPKPVREAKPAKEPKPPRDAKPDREPKPAREQIARKVARANRGREALDGGFPAARPEEDRRGLSAVTIFLAVLVVLLVGAGGAGFWAWREGFINLDTMFGNGTRTVQQAAVQAPRTTPARPEAPATGPGNTDTSAEAATPTAELRQDDRLVAEPVAPTTPALPLVQPSGRLTAEATPASAGPSAALAALDPSNLPGSQSLLLEASDNGSTGAVPFSGTVDWSKGTDEMGLPTLIGKANIPARNLGVDVLIRKNSDPSLPASHLMEINFRVNDGFIGGSVAGLPGVLLKNEELVQGTPLVGASARVVGNTFLFALSASPADIATNSTLLTTRKWIDLAIIYATGKRAIITLEKDDTAQSLFSEVQQAWARS